MTRLLELVRSTRHGNEACGCAQHWESNWKRSRWDNEYAAHGEFSSEDSLTHAHLIRCDPHLFQYCLFPFLLIPFNHHFICFFLYNFSINLNQLHSFSFSSFPVADLADRCSSYSGLSLNLLDQFDDRAFYSFGSSKL